MEEAAQRIRRLAHDLCSDKPLGENSQKGKKKPGLSKPRNPVIPSGAGGGTRTPTMSPSADFESNQDRFQLQFITVL